MLKDQNEMIDTGCLRLRGYRVIAFNPEFDELAAELERALPEGVPAYRDLARSDFYYVVLGEEQAYIHVYRRTNAVYLVAVQLSPVQLDTALSVG